MQNEDYGYEDFEEEYDEEPVEEDIEEDEVESTQTPEEYEETIAVDANDSEILKRDHPIVYLFLIAVLALVLVSITYFMTKDR